MTQYRVNIYYGDYRERQAAANRDKAALYLEQHINSSAQQSPDYGLAVIATNGSQRSYEIAHWYAKEAGTRFDVGGPDDADVGYGDGVRKGGDGNDNLYYTDMPAVLLEPWFASNPEQSKLMNSPKGIEMAARLLEGTVRRFAEPGALIAFSVGHLGKRSNPDDRGAVIYNGGTEADWSQSVMTRAAALLRRAETPQPERLVLRISVPDREDQAVEILPGTTLRIEQEATP